MTASSSSSDGQQNNPESLNAFCLKPNKGIFSENLTCCVVAQSFTFYRRIVLEDSKFC